jgi:uncharacterized protein (TIGR00730 family)
MRRICVFCGSGAGKNDRYSTVTVDLARELAARGLGLVYGGGRVGLMGVLAEAALTAGAEVIGVIPRDLLNQEVACLSIADLRVVGSMHERKALMAELADGFVALPGGLGTLEEFFEMLTWAQLGLQRKPCGLLNVDGYFDQLQAFLDHALAEGFLQEANRSLLLVADRPGALLDAFSNWQPPPFDKAKWALTQMKTGNKR